MYPLSMETFGEDWNESQFWVCLFCVLLPFPGALDERCMTRSQPC